MLFNMNKAHPQFIQPSTSSQSKLTMGKTFFSMYLKVNLLCIFLRKACMISDSREVEDRSPAYIPNNTVKRRRQRRYPSKKERIRSLWFTKVLRI